MKNQRFSVTITCTPEQVEKLKAVLAEIQDGHWKDWKDYARTMALIGFQERLEERYKALPDTST